MLGAAPIAAAVGTLDTTLSSTNYQFLGDIATSNGAVHQQTARCVFSAYHAYIFIYAKNTLIGCMRK
jgi:hypothetical protein